MSRRVLVLVALLALVASLASLGGCDRAAPTHVDSAHGAPSGGKEIWTCPMHPEVTSDRPGHCPICKMSLVKAKAPAPAPSTTDEARPAGFAPIVLDEEQQKRLGLKTITVARAPLGGVLRTTGRVAIDETRVHRVTARFEGYIEKLYADYTGKLVKQGEPLAAIYSPELVASQEELLLATRSQSELSKSGLPDMTRSARERLRRYGITEADIDQLVARGTVERTSILRAPRSGFVTQKSTVAGAKVNGNDSLFEIVDLSTLWVVADVYENELPRLRVGQSAVVTLAYWPGRRWQGKVTQILPTVDDKTRTIKVRIALENPKYELKPEMFCTVELQAPPREALVIDEDALIESGTRQLVFLVREGGQLEPRQIETGLRADGKVEVLRGLVTGDRVAAGASFLLDSESRLRAAVSELPSHGALEPEGAHR